MGELVLYEIPYAFAVPSDFERSDTGVPIAGTVFVGVVAVGTDGVGFATALFRIVEYPTDIMADTRVTGENVDADREKETSEPCCSGSVAVAIVGTGDERNVFADVEHVVVLVGEIAEIVA